MINQKEPVNLKYSKFFSCMITDDAKCTHEIHSGIDMAEAAFKTPFHLQTGLEI